MNDHTERSTSRLWAYVHGELPEADRRAVRDQIDSDPDVRREVEALGRFDRRLRATLAVLDADEDAWADRALAAWDREVAGSAVPGVSGASRGKQAAPAGHPRPATAPAVWGRRLRWPLLAGLAAAASLLLLFLPSAGRTAVTWQPASFSPLLTRGSAPETSPRLPPAIASTCAQALRRAVDDACRARGLALRPGIVVSVRIQELPEGAFAILVQARLRDGALVEEWSGDYSSLDSFLRQLPASAAQMAEALAARAAP